MKYASPLLAILAILASAAFHAGIAPADDSILFSPQVAYTNSQAAAPLPFLSQLTSNQCDTLWASVRDTFGMSGVPTNRHVVRLMLHPSSNGTWTVVTMWTPDSAVSTNRPAGAPR